MRYHKSKGVLERGAASDLWRTTLSQIPSVFGRLVYLTSLRDPNSGSYSHHGLALVFGEEESLRALVESHEQAFHEWICYTLEQQKADLLLYLSALMDNRRVIIDTWLRLSPYRNLVPNRVVGPEREQYLSDFEALLQLLKNESGVCDPDPDA